jgi:hypothetical protein
VNPSLPEPSHLTPTGGGLRASDADRDQVATVLNTAYAEGRLSLEEHDERLEQVLAAKTFNDLIPITCDLVVAYPSAAAGHSSGPSTSQIRIEGSAPHGEPERLVAIFGGASRRGKWRVRRTIHSIALFGGIDLDFRDAIFEDHLVELTGFWCFGGLDIKLPGGMEVRDQTAGIFGGTDVADLGEPQPGAPTLVIKGLALFGGVNVRGPKPEKRKKR